MVSHSLKSQHIRQDIRRYLSRVLDDHAVLEGQADHMPLVTSNRLSSLQIVLLAEYFEAQYGIHFSKIGFDPFWFETIEDMSALILRQGTEVSR